METKATVKMIGEKKTGISQSTGNAWMTRAILLEWFDSEGTHRVWGILFNEQDDSFEQQGIIVGDMVVARLRFTTRSYRTGFVSTDVKIEEIKKA